MTRLFVYPETQINLMNDYVLRLISKENNVRGLFATTTNLAREARERHQTRGAATPVLAESLTGAALMGALLKVRHRMAMKLEGNGPIRKVVVEADSYGHVRGYVAVPDLTDYPTLTAGEALGAAGLLTVTKDVKLKDLVKGVVHLETSDIAKDLTYYLNQSEQVPSLINLGVVLDENGDIQAAGGLLLQSLPPYDESVIERYTDRLQELPPLKALFKEGKTPEQVAEIVMEDNAYDVLENRPLSFRCQCSRARSRQALLSIGPAEIRDLIDQIGRAVVDCPFCHDQYVFEVDELEMLIEELR